MLQKDKGHAYARFECLEKMQMLEGVVDAKEINMQTA